MNPKLLLQYERLRRHYNTAIKTYDHVSLLDLSHSLRIWTELKKYMSIEYSKEIIKQKFKTSSPNKKLSKQLRSHEYVITYFQKTGVTTYANNGSLISIINRNKRDGYYSATVQGQNTLKRYSFVSGESDKEIEKLLNSEKTTTVNFPFWMSSEIVRLKFLNTDGIEIKESLSREIVIKRIANTMDGSHTSLNDEGGNDNRFDEPIKWMFDNHRIGGLPLPYFILLKIAKDILEIMPKILNEKK